MVDRFAVALDGAGVTKGDRIGLMSPNTIEYVVAFFGSIRVGAVVTQMNPLYIASSDGPVPQTAVDPERDLAVLQYTGGTTGRSKGAMLTHRNLLSAVQPTFDLVIKDPAAFPPNAKAIAVAPSSTSSA